MSLVINPLRASFKEETNAEFFLEEWAERVDSLELVNSPSTKWEKEALEKEAIRNIQNDINFKVSEEKLLRNTLENIKMSNKYALEAAKREKKFYSDNDFHTNNEEVPDTLAEISKEYLVKNCILLKERILFCYTIKQKLLMEFINSFSGFTEKFVNDNNNKKVYKVNFYIYHAEDILNLILDFLKDYKKTKVNTFKDRQVLFELYRVLLSKIKKMKDEFNGYLERESNNLIERDCYCDSIYYSPSLRRIPIKNADKEQFRYIPFEIFKDKFAKCKTSAEKIISSIVEEIKSYQKDLLSIIKRIDKIQGNKVEGKKTIKKVNEMNDKLNMLTTMYLKDLYSFSDKIFTSLNKVESFTKGSL